MFGSEPASGNGCADAVASAQGERDAGVPSLIGSGVRASHLSCGCCGLSVRVKAAWLAIEHCPRCIARRGQLVPLVSSDDPHRVTRARRDTQLKERQLLALIDEHHAAAQQ